ncbi:MAG: hypothetical protein RIS86_311 [Planctomycetota bacterium]|jgi:hypothetical protein
MPPSTTTARQDPFDAALARFRALPRAGKWGVGAAIAFGGFWFLDSVAWPQADAIDLRTDRLEATLARAAARAEELPEEVVRSAIVHGENAIPRAESVGKEQLATTIDEALRANGVSNYGLDVRPSQPLPDSVLPEVAASQGGKMGRTVADLRFEATPDATTAIIAALDSSASIDAISDLRLSYNAGTKRVGVQMTVEKWGVVRRNARTGR